MNKYTNIQKTGRVPESPNTHDWEEKPGCKKGVVKVEVCKKGTCESVLTDWRVGVSSCQRTKI